MNTARDAVMRLMDNSAALLLRAGDSLDDDEFFAQPEVGASFAWTLGHLAAFQDWALSNIDSVQERFLDSDTREFFRGGKPISEDFPAFGARAEIEDLFKSTQARALSVLRDFDIDRWAETTPTGCRYPTMGAVWESMAYENFWHLGQLSVCIPQFQGTAITVPVPRPYKLPFGDREDIESRLAHGEDIATD